jgi:hypothetical protein
MSHGVLIQNKVAALNIDAFNRAVISASAIDNGNVFNLLSKSSTAGSEVWLATQPATGSLVNLWMAYEPEVVQTVSGNSTYKGIDPDPRNFYNIAGDVFSAFKLQVGDIITVTADAIGGSKSSNEYVVATNEDYELNWSATTIASGVNLKLMDTTYMSIGSGSAIGTQRVTAYQFEVISVA